MYLPISEMYAQKPDSNKIDSLISLLKNYKNNYGEFNLSDTVRANLLFALSKELIKSNPDTVLKLGNEALEISQKIHWQLGVGKSLNILGFSNNIKGNNAMALNFFYRALSIWENIIKSAKDGSSISIEINKAYSLSGIGMIYWAKGEYIKSITYCSKALEYSQSLGNIELAAKSLNNIGLSYWKQANYSKALDYFFRSADSSKALIDQSNLSIALGNIGLVYSDEGRAATSNKDLYFEKALDFFFRAFKINAKIKNKYSMAQNLNNIGIVFKTEASFQVDTSNAKIYYAKALDYYLQALELNEELGNKRSIIKNLGNIGNIYGSQKDYIRELSYHLKALQIAIETGDKNSVSINLGNVGDDYISLKKYSKAKQYLFKALTTSDSLNSFELTRDDYFSISKLYEEIADYKNSLNYYKKAVVFDDSLFNEEKAEESTRTEMNYQFEKMQDSTKAVQDKRDATTNAEISKQKIIRNSVIGGSGAVALIGALSFVSFRNKRKKEKAELSQLVSETEMRALRSQMNPHFIFNALQSIQKFLTNHQSEEANTYLIKFSKLMRAVLENSLESEVPVQDDLQALELYMQLESIRLKYPFSYKIDIDKTADTENDTIPPLILQPFVENAIWHGLQYKMGPGHINISISKKENTLNVVIEDNGVGRQKNKEFVQVNYMKKQSLGMKLTGERLKILNEIKNINAYFTITDLFSTNNEPIGTRIELLLPLVYDQNPDS